MRPDTARTSEPSATHTSSVEREVDSLMASLLIVAPSTVIRPVALMVVEFPANVAPSIRRIPLLGSSERLATTCDSRSRHCSHRSRPSSRLLPLMLRKKGAAQAAAPHARPEAVG